MRRLLNLAVNNTYRKPRVMNITNLMKKQTSTRMDNTHVQRKNERTLQSEQNNQHNKEDSISWREVNMAINRSQQTYTKQELEINHLIKIETKTSSLYQIYKSKYTALSPKNVVNLLIKMLQLRYINSKASQQTDKLDKIVALAQKKLHKMTPEDMIRFLFSLKQVRINSSDLTRIHSFIMDILKEFSGRSMIKGVDTLKTFESFEVMSVQSTIKLIHSLQYLHEISGRQYEPQITILIKQSLNYFHTFVKNNLNKHKQKYIKWHLYFSLIELLIQYQMPTQMVIDFMKALFNHKKSFIGVHQNLVNLELSITKMNNIEQIRGDQITKYRQLFAVYQIMYQTIQKPEELIKIRPNLLIKHLKALNWFTQKQLSLLGFEKIKQITYVKVLNFTLKTLHKYLSKDYSTQLQKSIIEEWVSQGSYKYKDYLGQFLDFYYKRTKQSNSIYANDFNKILNLCLQFYSQLTFNTQAVILQISILRKFKNTKYIIDIFFGGENSKENGGKRTRYFKKYQQIQSYIQLFNFWKEIRSETKFSFDQHREGVFIKSFFRAIIHMPSLQSYPKLFANKIQEQPQFLNLMVKKFKKFSIENRSLSKVYIDKVQDFEFKKQLQSINQVIQKQNQDDFILSSYSSMKHNIRQKAKRSLQIYKFFIIIFQNLRERKIIAENNITNYELFQEITAQFQQEMQCLYYKQLFTLQIYELATEITQYLKSKTDRQFKVYNIEKHRQRLKINVEIQKNKGLFSYFCSELMLDEQRELKSKQISQQYTELKDQPPNLSIGRKIQIPTQQIKGKRINEMKQEELKMKQFRKQKESNQIRSNNNSLDEIDYKKSRQF